MLTWRYLGNLSTFIIRTYWIGTAHGLIRQVLSHLVENIILRFACDNQHVASLHMYVLVIADLQIALHIVAHREIPLPAAARRVVCTRIILCCINTCLQVVPDSQYAVGCRCIFGWPLQLYVVIEMLWKPICRKYLYRWSSHFFMLELVFRFLLVLVACKFRFLVIPDKVIFIWLFL